VDISLGLTRIDEFLRGGGPFHPTRIKRLPWWSLAVLILCFSPLYGGLMGSFHFVSAERVWQVAFAGIKMPLLLFATSVLCLPAFFVLNSVLGLRDDLRESLLAILAGQAALSIVLAALGPLTRFWYFSGSTYRAALLFNAGAFALATFAGHIVMSRYYRQLIRRHRHHRIGLYAWVSMYAFVGIQMGWTLRPFIGSPNMPVAFFRDGPFSNAYVVVAGLVFGS